MKSRIVAIGAVLLAMGPVALAQENIYPEEFELSSVRLLPGSPFAHACELNTEVLMQYDVDRLLAPYLKEAGLPPKAKSFPNWDGLDGHIGGHYLSALAMHYAATGRKDLKDRLDYAISELARCAEANGNGYVGGVPAGAEVWEAVRNGDVEAVWKRWVPWYNIHKTYAGLRDAWLYAGNKQARDLFLGFCDWALNLTDGLPDSRMERMLDEEHGGMPEVMADAYAISGDERYLRGARRFSHHKILDNMAADRDILDNMHANTQVPKVVGFQRIAELSGDTTYAHASDFFWHTVTGNRSIAIGGNSRREHFPAADDYLSYVTDREGPESCNTNNMLKLTEGLHRMKPSVEYADFYERARYNHVLSTQHPHHGGYVYFTSARPGHYRVYSQPNSAMWCCVGTGMENHGKYAKFIYSYYGKDSLMVNLFIPSRLDWADRGIILEQTTGFPAEESSKLTLNLKKASKFTLLVRQPSWCQDFSVTVNGKPVPYVTDASGYAAITRKWRNGDVVEVSLPMKFSIERLENRPEYIAILRGPIVLGAKLDNERLDGILADDSRWAHIAHGPLRSVFETPVILADSAALIEAIQPAVNGETMQYTLSGVFADPSTTVTLQPFHTIHDSRYMMYWLSMSPDDYAAHREQLRRDEAALLALDARTVDAVRCGEQQPEADHYMEAVSSESGVFYGQPYRRAYNGGFTYKMRTQRRPDLKLMVRYWGNETGRRQFDVVVNGEVLATENIGDRWREDRFIDVEYNLPESVAESDTVTVGFRCDGGFAGDVYHVRLVHPQE